MKFKSSLLLALTFILINCGGGGGPGIDSISPDHGTQDGGTKVTITGNNFVDIIQVTVGNVDCLPIHVISKNKLTCTTGENALVITDAIVDVVVLDASGSHGTLDNGFTYQSH